MVDHFRRENEEMRETLNKAEIRNSKLIKEADDRYLTIEQSNDKKLAQTERKWQKKLHSAQKEFERDKETIMSQCNYDVINLQKEIGGF